MGHRELVGGESVREGGEERWAAREKKRGKLDEQFQMLANFRC